MHPQDKHNIRLGPNTTNKIINHKYKPQIHDTKLEKVSDFLGIDPLLHLQRPYKRLLAIFR